MQTAAATGHATLRRTVVHVLLVATAAISLVAEPVLAAHVLVGLTFCALAAAHLSQRRRTVRALLKQLGTPSLTRSGRLAWADLCLALLTVVMLASGLVDWALGHPTRIRWHAISGVLLAAALLVHTARRRAKVRRSVVR